MKVAIPPSSRHGSARARLASMQMEHGPTPAGDRRALIISGLLTGAYFVVELAVGLWSGSVAVMSDAFHTFSAVGGVLVALVAQRLSERPASVEHTFGWRRAEIVGALFNGLFLFGMGAYVIWMGAMRLMQPIELPTSVMLYTASGGIITELIAFRLLYKRQKEDLNIKGAYWHILQTFGGSLIIVITALVVRFTGFLQIDPLLGMAFGLLLFWASWRILGAALRILMQGTPKGLDLSAAIVDLRGIDGVSDVHHVHAWSLTSGRNVFSGHLRVQSYETDGERVLREATDHLREHFGIYFSTLQIEEACLARDEPAAIDITKDLELADRDSRAAVSAQS